MPPATGRGGVSLPLVLYGAATGLLEPFAPLALNARVRRGKEDPARLGERLGRASRARPPGPLVWLHGVSVGESVSLLPLVGALRTRRPDLGLLVTSGTRTSAEILAQRLPAGVVHQYAPVDAPGAVRRFLDHWRPSLAVFVESELWPNVLGAARRRGVRLALLSARMTQASHQGWSRAPASARELLGAFDLVMPQDEATARRLAQLGAVIGPPLNLKRVGAPLPADDDTLRRFREAVGGRAVVLAASTHPGEEALIAGAFRAAVDDPAQALLVIAPRHPERGPALAAGFGAPRRSAGEPPAGPIYIADTLGEMGLLYRAADVVVMGGAFATGVGGHNPLEAARLGRAVITGPEAFNAAELYREMIDQGGATEVPDEPALAEQIRRRLEDRALAGRMDAAALAYAASQDGALDAALAALEPLLP